MKIEQWRTGDILLHTGKSYNNPFEDVDVFGVFTAPSGRVLRLLGFWDGDGNWIVRFAPTEAGMWTYRTESTDGNPDFVSAGSVDALPYGGDLDIYRHGFPRVADNRRILAYADGKPFFWLADTHWRFATEERFDESNCPKYASQFKACVDKRVEQKFTVYLSNFRDGASAGIFGKSLDLMHDNGDGTFTPNLPLFQNDLDQKMRYIADAGLVNAVGYAWGYDMEANGQARYIRFAKYTAARYGAYPVIWTLAGELPGYGAAEKLRETVELWNPVAKEAEKWCAYENLQTVHLANSRPFARIYADETWFDFALCQSGHGDFDMSPVMYKELREMYAGHPVIEGETTYEGIWSRELVPRYVDADTFRRTSYLMLQMGGAGTTYGANGVWELQWEAGVGGIGWGDMAWYDGLELPGAWQMTVLREFYESVDWGTLSPLGEDRFTTGGGFFGVDPSGARSVYALGNDDMTTVVLYYQPTSMPIYTIKGLTAEAYALYEVDTETGKRQKVREIRPEQGVYREMPAGGFRRSHGKPHDQLFVLKAL